MLIFLLSRGTRAKAAKSKQRLALHRSLFLDNFVKNRLPSRVFSISKLFSEIVLSRISGAFYLVSVISFFDQKTWIYFNKISS